MGCKDADNNRVASWGRTTVNVRRLRIYAKNNPVLKA